MRSLTIRRGLLVSSVVLAFLSSCAPTEVPREGVLTFDGSTCRYDGPEEVSAGEFTITLNNQSDREPSLWIIKLDEGRTWQQLLDYIGPPGSNVHPPEWSTGSIMMAPSAEDPNARILTLTEGIYALCCCTCYDPSGPRGVWPGTALQVTSE